VKIGILNLDVENQIAILEGSFFLNLDKLILGRNLNSLNGNLNKVVGNCGVNQEIGSV